MKNAISGRYRPHFKALAELYDRMGAAYAGVAEPLGFTRRVCVERAEEVARQAAALLAQGLQPGLMCPLNDDGLCGLYKHRLMICRLHGVPHRLAPAGRPAQRFPGCFRCQELVQAAGSDADMDRTPLYVELAALEKRFLGAQAGRLPRVDLTLAQMIVAGPPRL